MAAKQSAEMRHALELVDQKWSVRSAAEQAGVRRESLYAAIRKIRLERQGLQTQKGN